MGFPSASDFFFATRCSLASICLAHGTSSRCALCPSVRPRILTKHQVDTPAHRQLALEAAQQGIVLALNRNKTLPLSAQVVAARQTAATTMTARATTVAVVGPNAAATSTLLSNYHGQPPFTPVSVVAGLEARGVAVHYAEGCTVAGDSTDGIAAAEGAAASADATVVVIGLDETQEREGHDRTSIRLPGVQEELVKRVAAAAAPRAVTVVVISGGCAIVFCFFFLFLRLCCSCRANRLRLW
jgi:beta-D-xylosidase 4